MRYTMKTLILSLVLATALSKPTSWSSEHQYALPDGTGVLLGSVRSTFKCFADGYYADTDNNCQIFHVCVTPEKGRQLHYSFVCGNQTVFNQLTFTCTYPEDSVPCIRAQDFYYLNNHLNNHDSEVHFLDDLDIQMAAPLIAEETYARRVHKPLSHHEVGKRRFDFKQETR